MIELRWLVYPHPRFEGLKLKKLQYRTFQLVGGPDPIKECCAFSGHWGEWQDVPEELPSIVKAEVHGQ